jgi:hypothetical protein
LEQEVTEPVGYYVHPIAAVFAPQSSFSSRNALA